MSQTKIRKPKWTLEQKRRLFEDAGRVSFVDLQDHGRAKIRFESPYDADQGLALILIK